MKRMGKVKGRVGSGFRVPGSEKSGFGEKSGEWRVESGEKNLGFVSLHSTLNSLSSFGYQLLAIGLVLLGSLALAGQARLELDGKAQITRADGSAQSYNRSGGVALNLSLDAGDRLCVTEGKGKLSYGVKAYVLTSPGASCFEVAKPKRFWDNLVASCQDIGVCKKEAQKAFVKEAKSRGGDGATPALYLPTDYSLSTLSLPIAGGQSLRLINASGKELLALSSDGNGLFAVSTDKLKGASRIEVQNASGVVLYAAPVRWVMLESEVSPSNPHEAALELWLTGNVSYAPAAFSYLLASNDTDLASTVASRIGTEFRGTAQ